MSNFFTKPYEQLEYATKSGKLDSYQHRVNITVEQILTQFGISWLSQLMARLSLNILKMLKAIKYALKNKK